MTQDIKDVLKLALEALKPFTTPNWAGRGVDKCNEAIAAIKEALREHAMREVQRLGQEIEQEPVAWLSTDSIGERHLCFDKPLDNDPVQPLYTSPPQRTWVDLTDEEIDNINYTSAHMLAREVLAKLKEKNT